VGEGQGVEARLADADAATGERGRGLRHTVAEGQYVDPAFVLGIFGFTVNASDLDEMPLLTFLKVGVEKRGSCTNIKGSHNISNYPYKNAYKLYPLKQARRLRNKKRATGW